MNDWRCADCHRRGAQPLSELSLAFPCDHRIASVVVLALKRIIDQLVPPRGAEERILVVFTADDDDTGPAAVFGREDAHMPLHGGSRYWAVLASVAEALREASGATCRFETAGSMCPSLLLPPQGSSGESSGPAGSAPSQGSSGSGAMGNATASAEASGFDASHPVPPVAAPPLASPQHQPTKSACTILALRISWSERQSPAIAAACGTMLRSWFPSHAAAHRPCWGLQALAGLSAANRGAAAATVLGWHERRLVETVLRQSGGDVASVPLAGRGGGGGGGAAAQLFPEGTAAGRGGQLVGSASRYEAASLLAALPYCWQVEWRSFGRYERQGQALVTLTNGRGLFLIIDVRHVPLVRTGAKARGASLSRPGRFGQAAKASLGPPGRNEDLALRRRRRSRRAAAGAAVGQAAEMAQQATSAHSLGAAAEESTGSPQALGHCDAVATDPGLAPHDGAGGGSGNPDGGEDPLPSTLSLPALLAPTLPPGSLVFPALLTSDLEGLQVAAEHPRGKQRGAALIAALLGLPGVPWPEYVAERYAAGRGGTRKERRVAARLERQRLAGGGNSGGGGGPRALAAAAAAAPAAAEAGDGRQHRPRHSRGRGQRGTRPVRLGGGGNGGSYVDWLVGLWGGVQSRPLVSSEVWTSAVCVASVAAIAVIVYFRIRR